MRMKYEDNGDITTHRKRLEANWKLFQDGIGLYKIPIKHSIAEMQKSAILGMACTLRKT
jgi:hypothetical protein